MDCFRTCDIRGKYPQEVNEQLFFQLGWGIAQKYSQDRPVLVGCDLRPSSVPLKMALTEGLTAAGARVLDSGCNPTPVICFGKRTHEVSAAAIVTASHNPPDENGLKLLLGHYPATARQLRSLISDQKNRAAPRTRGRIEIIDLAEPYLEFLTRTWRPRLHASSDREPLKVVFDPGNGSWTLMIAEVIRRLEIAAKVIHAAPDGSYPGRSPDCATPGSLASLAKEVRLQEAALGIAWDGDGDRVAICDDSGKPLLTDQVMLLLIPEILRGTQSEKVLYDVKMSKKIRAAVEEQNGVPIVERSAHCFLENRMITEGCLLGCEFSGHIFFRDLAGADDGLYAGLVVAEYLQRNHMPLSELVRRLPALHITTDLRIPARQAEFLPIKKRLEEEFSSAAFDYFDGIRIELPRAWFLVRPSVSESKLSLRFEGDTAEDLDAILDRVLQLMRDHRAALQAQLDQWRRDTPLA